MAELIEKFNKAAENGNLNELNNCIQNGVDLNHNQEASRIACVHGHYNIVKRLIDVGATIHKAALFYACSTDSVELVKLLIDKGFDVNYRSPILNAANKGNYEIVSVLLEHGANQQLNLAVYYAGLGHYEDVVEILFEYGAKIDWIMLKDINNTLKAKKYTKIRDMFNKAELTFN
jgi:ankyrin repeat protein